MIGIIGQALGCVAQWVAQNPSMACALVRRLQMSYETMKPEEKEKIRAAVRWGGKLLLKHALSEVLGEVGQRAVSTVGSEQAGEIAKALLTRGAEIGIERALEEADRR